MSNAGKSKKRGKKMSRQARRSAAQKVMSKTAGQTVKADSAEKKMDSYDWGDLSEFGSILPLGTDMLKDKPVYRFFKRFFACRFCGETG